MQTDYILCCAGFVGMAALSTLAPTVSGFPSAAFPASVLRRQQWRAEHRGIAPAGPSVAYAIDRENSQRSLGASFGVQRLNVSPNRERKFPECSRPEPKAEIRPGRDRSSFRILLRRPETLSS